MEDALYEDKLAGVISDSRYQSKRADFADQAEQIMARLSKLNEIQAERDVELPGAKNKIVALYVKSTPGQKRIILSAVFKKMILSDGLVVIERT